MKRRQFITGAAVAGAATATTTLAAPAVAQERYEFTMVTPWPKGFPGLGTSAERTAQRLESLSNGRIKINFYAAGELVPAFEAFDAVTSGTADMMHATPYYWQGNSPALNFFTAAPFSLSVTEHDAWMRHGGGQELWDEVYDGFGLKAWNAGNTGPQMAGWFPEEIKSLDDLQGLSFRTAGLGGEAWRRIGLNVQTLPGGEIFQALQSGTLDAADWVGPWNDLALGFHRVVKHYYAPSLIEPSAALELTVNKSRLTELPEDLQELFAVVAASEQNIVTAEFNAQNIRALDTLVNEHDVQVHQFPDDVLEAWARACGEVVAEAAASDEPTGRIVESLSAFRKNAIRWATYGEAAFYQARLTDIPYPA